MSFPLILAEASSRFSSLFFVLFLAFAIAALVWLLIWLFSEGDSGEYAVRSSADDSGSTASTEDADRSDSDDKDGESDASDGDDASDPTDADDSAGESEDGGEESSGEEEASTGTDTGEGNDGGDFEAATEEEAAKLFASELENGDVTQDPVYGIVYKEAPSETDDLKEIKGVAKVLEGKLNGVGVYRFKQVAVWTDAACAEFSKMLTFKNRIYTDNWLDQARELHEKKYNEKL